MSRPILLALVLLLTAPVLAAAEVPVPHLAAVNRPEIGGVWQLDLAQTKMWKRATRPLWRVDEIRLEGSDMHWSWHAEEPKGPWKAKVLLATDGRETRNEIAGHHSRSHGAWRGDTLTFVTRGRAFLLPYRLDDSIYLSHDGRVMNVLRKFRMATLNEDEHWVFRRVEGEAALLPPQARD